MPTIWNDLPAIYLKMKETCVHATREKHLPSLSSSQPKGHLVPPVSIFLCHNGQQIRTSRNNPFRCNQGMLYAPVPPKLKTLQPCLWSVHMPSSIQNQLSNEHMKQRKAMQLNHTLCEAIAADFMICSRSLDDILNDDKATWLKEPSPLRHLSSSFYWFLPASKCWWQQWCK